MLQPITITSDFGHKDYYLAIIKGTILASAPQVQFIDISNEVKPFNIVEAAFMLRNAWPHFPKSTIHLISVDDFSESKPAYLVAHFQDHYFVAPDNGFFSLLFPNQPVLYYRVALQEQTECSIKEVFARVVNHLTQQRPIGLIGPAVKDTVQRFELQPVLTHSRIQGAVIYIDRYENVITNISQALFESHQHNRAFSVMFKRNKPINTLVRHYHDVPTGEPLCRFNSAGYLEIAVNMGKASSLLNLTLEDAILIDFQLSTLLT